MANRVFVAVLVTLLFVDAFFTGMLRDNFYHGEFCQSHISCDCIFGENSFSDINCQNT